MLREKGDEWDRQNTNKPLKSTYPQNIMTSNQNKTKGIYWEKSCLISIYVKWNRTQKSTSILTVDAIIITTKYHEAYNRMWCLCNSNEIERDLKPTKKKHTQKRIKRDGKVIWERSDLCLVSEYKAHSHQAHQHHNESTATHTNNNISRDSFFMSSFF